jgi:hypothetical protein
MPDRAWKQTERRTAAILGGKRVPVSGRGRGDVPDVEHDHLSIECKHRRVMPQWIKDALDQAVAASDGRQRLPIVVIHEHGKRHLDDVVMVSMRDWISWYGPVMNDE